MKSARPASTFHSPARGATLKCLLLLCALSLTSTPASAAQSSDSSQVVEHVHGVVINAVDKKPIARALVTTGDQRMATMTDVDGRFTFDVRRPSPGSSRSNSNTGGSFPIAMMSGSFIGRPMNQMMISVTVRRPGYLQNQLPIRLSSDPQSSEEIELKLIPEAILRGHLSLSNGTKPSGVVVQLRRKQVQDGVAMWTQAGGVQANSRGDYSFADLPAGDYKLMSQAWSEQGFGRSSGTEESFGCPPAYYGDTADLTSSPVIHLAAGQTVEANLNLRSSALYHVTVPVSGMTKGEGFNVTVGSQQDQSGFFMNFNPQTQMAEGFLPNGAYDLHVNSFGQPQGAGTGRVEVAGKPVTGTPIVLAPIGQIPVIVHQQFTASDSAQQSSRQQMMTPRRLLDINLRPVNLDGPWSGLKNPTSKDDQDLILENVQPGTYRVIITPTRGYVAAMSLNGVDLLRQPLVVGPGGAGGAIDIVLRDDAATLTGTVSSPNTTATQPDPDTIFAIFCIPLDAGSAMSMPGIIAQQGKFTVPNLAPGEYLVLAVGLTPSINSFPNIEYRNPDVLREYLTKGTTVTLTSGQKAEIQVPLLANPDGGN